MRVKGIEVFHWNPKRKLVNAAWGERLPRGRRIRNFGDMLGPAIVAELTQSVGAVAEPADRRLLAVGSILHFAQNGDVVWGAGVNGKEPLSSITATELDIRAVRGPLTAAALSGLGFRAPEIFGDPGLLAPALFGISRSEVRDVPLTSLPNLHDIGNWRKHPGFLSPRTKYRKILHTVARSQRVITSSLHGVVIAEALDVPVSLVRPSHETTFKYEDYFEGTGRRLPRPADSFSESLGPIPPLSWDSGPLLAAFPSDLWQPSSHDHQVLHSGS